MAKKNPKKPAAKLTTLGQSAETLLRALVADMAKDVKDSPDGKARRYTLTDQMKVVDRILKAEAIKAKMEDDGEGAFFGNDETEPGAEDEP